jgi:hypothetical protein
MGIMWPMALFNLDKTIKQLGITDKQPLLPTEEAATLRQLIESRSGVYHPSGSFGQADYMPKRGSHPPGTSYVYNNWDFWAAVSVVLSDAWNAPRAHVLNKGVGVYALMEIAADLQQEAGDQICDKRYFSHKLSEFIDEIDWTQKGTFDGLGGQTGVAKMVASIREVRGKSRLTLVKHG